MSKTVYVDCPFCEGMLEVDIESGQVVQKWSAGDRKQSSDDKLKGALQKIEDDKKRRGNLFSEITHDLEGKKKTRNESFLNEIKKINKEGLKDRPLNPFERD